MSLIVKVNTITAHSMAKNHLSVGTIPFVVHNYVLAGSIELRTCVPPVLPEIHLLDMLLHSPEMHIQFVQVLQ